MEIVVNNLEGCKKSIEITLPEEKTDGVYKELLADFKNNLRVPGFRKGKVPETLIKRRFSKELKQEVLNKLIPKALDDAIKEKNLRPVERPTLDDVEYDEGQPLKIKASFETRPELQLDKYSELSITLEKNKYLVTDNDVDIQLEIIRQKSATYKPVEEDRGIVLGDFVQINYRGEPLVEDGIPFMRENVDIEIVDAKEDGGFSINLVGSRVNQKPDFTVEYPEDFGDPALAGAKIKYSVEVITIKERILPDLDDEFAKDLGKFEKLEEVREELRRQLEHEKTHQRHSDTVDKLLEEIISKNPQFDLPLVMVQRQLVNRENDLRRQIVSRGVNPEHFGFDWSAFRKEERPKAEKSVRVKLILDEIAEKENIKVTGKETRAEIDSLALSSEQDPKELRRDMLSDGRYDAIAAHLRENKVSNWLIENNKVLEG